MTSLPPSRPLLHGLVSLTIGALLAIGACSIPRPTPAGITAQTAMTPAIDFMQYRWISQYGWTRVAEYVDPASGKALVLGDSVILDIAAVDSAWVTSGAHGADSTAGVTLSLTPRGAATFGAETATHIGQRLAVVIDGRVVNVATVSTRLGNIVPLVTDATPAEAHALATRVNRAIDKLRPYQPLVIPRPWARPDRVIVRVTSLGLRNVDGRPTILFFTTGSALLGVAGATPTPLTDTLTLTTLPAFTADLTHGDLHLQLQGSGMLEISGTVEGGPMASFSAAGRHIVLHSRGSGISPFFGIANR